MTAIGAIAGADITRSIGATTGGNRSICQGCGMGGITFCRGWVVANLSCTPAQSSPLFCDTSASRSMRTVLLAESSVAR